jgi:anti-anti-sigma factor
MEIKIETQGNETVLKIIGRVDTATSAEFEKAIAPLLQSDMKMVIVDCKEFEYISSTGLRLFLTLQKNANGKGGKLIIREMNADIKSVFDMTGFTALFTFE